VASRYSENRVDKVPKTMALAASSQNEKPITLTEMRIERGNSSPRRRSPTSAARSTMSPSTPVR
jgi:hypothetical protein